MDSRIKEFMMRKIWKIPLYLITALVGASITTAAVMFNLRIPIEFFSLPPIYYYFDSTRRIHLSLRRHLGFMKRKAVGE